MPRRLRSKAGTRGGLLSLTLLAAAGCSLLVPLDYVGGTAGTSSGGDSGNSASSGVGGTSSGTGGQEPLGGTSGGGGTGGSDGGAPPEAGTGGTGNEGGVGDAGTGGNLPSAGEDPGGQGGSSGSAGTGGDGVGGSAGATSGMGGGGRGGAGAGGRGGMGGCAGADLDTDHEHCGSCENACLTQETCLDGLCADSPCDGLCTGATTVNLTPGQGRKWDAIGTGDVCVEVTGYDPAPDPLKLVCWNFKTTPPPARVLELNGVTVPCQTAGYAFASIPERMNGYCIHARPGDHDYAGFELP